MALFARPPVSIQGMVRPIGGESPTVLGPRPESWQYDVWNIWRRVGEVRYPTVFLARQIGRLGWHVTVDGVAMSDEAGLALIDRAMIGMRRTEACYLAALNLEVGGEGWVIEIEPDVRQIYSPTSPDARKMWEAAKAAGRAAKRFWTPDPTDPQRADSSVATAIEPAEELLTLAALSRGQSMSRLSQAGILFFPSEMFDAIDETIEDVQANIEETITEAIVDEKSPAAMVPIVMQLPGEYVEQVRHLVMDRPYDDLIAEKVERSIRRISLALDIPPEVLTGSGDLSHWSAWSVTQETYTAHLEPLAQEVADMFADVIAHDLAVERDARDAPVVVSVTPDPRPVLAKRSTIRDALDAAKIGAVGLGYVREAIGAGDDDAPSDEELEILRLTPRDTGRWIEAQEVVGAPRPSGPTPLAASNGVPAEQVALIQARQRLGAKLRNTAEFRSDPRLKGVENEDVCAVVGDELPGWTQASIAEGLRPYMMCAGPQAAAELTARIVATLDVSTAEALSQVGWTDQEVAS